MTLKQLRYFLGVLRAGSFTRAAESLQVAQPAIGVQIRKLEDELGVKLLTRHSRGVVATGAGERLAPRAMALIGHAERVRQEIIEMDRAPRGQVALGLTGAAVPVLWARLVRSCRREYPDLHLTVTTVTEEMSHRLDGLLADGRLDVAVTYDPPEYLGVVSEALATEPLCFVVPPGHALADGREITLRAALEADLVLPPRPSMVGRQLADAARSNGAELRSICEAEPVAAMMEVVRLGMACAVLPYGAVRREVEAGDLAVLRIVDPRLTRTLNLTCSESRVGTGAFDAVRGEIRALVTELVSSGSAGCASCEPR